VAAAAGAVVATGAVIAAGVDTGATSVFAAVEGGESRSRISGTAKKAATPAPMANRESQSMPDEGFFGISISPSGSMLLADGGTCDGVF
jgi:hypothetical protein